MESGDGEPDVLGAKQFFSEVGLVCLVVIVLSNDSLFCMMSIEALIITPHNHFVRSQANEVIDIISGLRTTETPTNSSEKITGIAQCFLLFQT